MPATSSAFVVASSNSAGNLMKPVSVDAPNSIMVNTPSVKNVMT